jgi:glycyl-tRNA synthetase beta chain
VEKEGEHVWITQAIVGKPTSEVLAQILPDSIKGLTFDKAMRWGSLRMRFARPIRWILAAFDGQAVSFDIDDIEAGLESRGHRFNHPESFKATDFNHLVNELRARQVEPDPAVREKRIREEAEKVANGKPDMTDALVDENVFLTEWPTCVEGQFKQEFLQLPSPVLIIAMAKHEKFFPVRDETGKLTNRFVSVRNGGVDEVVTAGNAWVMNARFNDAKFFYDEDILHTFAEFLEKTKGIVFQDKLGTVHQRAYRLSELAAEVAKGTSATADEIEWARTAGLYAKADLSTGLVSELPALQGQIGAEYARREKFADPVCWAIASQYDLSLNPTIDCEGARTAMRLIVADQMDKLAGYLGIGQMPSGSSDPYGLRRAAGFLIEITLRWPEKFPDLGPLFERAAAGYQEQGFELAFSQAQVAELFRSRYASVFAASRHDLIDAALLNDYVGQPEDLQPQRVRFRISVMEKLADDIGFVQTATRPQNIVTAAVNKGIGFTFHDPLADLDLRALDSKEGEALAAAARTVGPAVALAASEENPDELTRHVRSLAEPINAFFDAAMVMADDEATRNARLTLLHGVNLILREAGDFSKIVVAGA